MTQTQYRVRGTLAGASLLVLSSPALALAEEENTGMKLLIPNMAEFVPACVAFIIIFVIMSKLAWPAILKMMEDREKKIQGDLDSAEKSRNDAAVLSQDAKAKVAEAEREAAEIIARADVGFATIWGLTDCADTIQEFADEALKEKYLPRICCGATCSMDLTEPDAGSDLQSVRLKATWDEAAKCWRLNGVKRFITNGDADLHLVLARSEEGSTDGRGLSYFVFDRADGGMTVRRIENKMGIKGSPTAELQFTNAPAQIVGERRLGLIKYVMSLMNGARLGVAAQSIGLCEAACREADAYAASREQFGHPINQFVAVQDLLDRMRARTDGARSLMYETARYVDLSASSRPASRVADILTPLVKLSASEFANRNAYDCIQVHGGSGFMKEYACERLYRDARILSIYEGTSQLQVVAAIKGIANGAYLKQIESYEARVTEGLAAACNEKAAPAADRQRCLEVLRKATDGYRRFYEMAVADGTTSERFEHATRALAEVLASIVMGYLLLLDSQRDARFLKSCRYFVREAIGQVNRHIAALEN